MRFLSANPTLLAYACLTVTSLCWGMNAVFGRAAVGEVSPMMLVAMRWVGVLVLVILFTRKDLKRDWPVLRLHLGFLAMLGLMGFTLFNALFYVAAHSTTAVNIGILQGSIPVFVLLGAFLAYRTPVAGRQVLGVAVTIVGVGVVAVGGDIDRLMTLAVNRGDFLMLMACFLYALYTVGLKRRPAVSALGMFAVMACAALLAAVPLVLTEAALGHYQAPTPKGWMLIGLVALLPSFLAQLTFLKGVEVIGPGRAGIFVNLVPIFAALLAVTFLGEQFQLYHALALTLVLGGIWLAERGKRPAPA